MRTYTHTRAHTLLEKTQKLRRGAHVTPARSPDFPWFSPLSRFYERPGADDATSALFRSAHTVIPILFFFSLSLLLLSQSCSFSRVQRKFSLRILPRRCRGDGSFHRDDNASRRARIETGCNSGGFNFQYPEKMYRADCRCRYTHVVIKFSRDYFQV